MSTETKNCLVYINPAILDNFLKNKVNYLYNPGFNIYLKGNTTSLLPVSLSVLQDPNRNKNR